MEDKTKGRGWIFKKPSKTTCFSLVFGGHKSRFWVLLGHLRGLGAILEASWASWGRLGGVLGRLGVLGNAWERPTIFDIVWGQDQDLRAQGQVVVNSRFWGLLLTATRGQ